ncbi:MAG TPA: LysR substrate-binding domain-containing protein [Streptosporangiaceae bacterium]|jgi:DNA-binding transcriptional LysR family regulator
MELRQLRYFVTVAEETSFTKAAALLHVAQPGVSAQVRQLERELGAALLDRSGRTVRLTEVGAAVLPYARAALGAAEGARHAVDELIGLVRGHVAIGMVGAFSSRELDLPGLLADFHRDHPAVEITLSEANSEQLIGALQAGRLDAAFISIGSTPPAGLALQIVVNEPIVAAVSPADPLAARTTITLEALLDRALICLPRGTGLRAILDEATGPAGLRPHIPFEAGEPFVLAQLAARGLGVAILPESAALAHPTALHVIGITRPKMWGRIAFAWRAEGPISPAARVLIERARAVLADSPAPP